MFFISFSSLWSFTFFFLFTYLTGLISLITYLLPILTSNTKYSWSKVLKTGILINGLDLLWVFITPYLILIFLNNLWVLPSISVWFGHLIITSFQLKINYLILSFFILVCFIFFSSIYFSSREVYDYVITTYSFCYWLVILFMSNSIFATIFVIEVISTLILLLLVTSTFSTTFFYRNLNLSFGHILQQSLPHTHLQSLLYFFWISLISSLNLFLFFLLMYTKTLTLDWFLLEYIFTYYVNVSSSIDIFSLGLYWLIMIFCIFVKCGITPLFFWKPTFFKGIPIYTLFFYIVFFYFFLFLFIIHFLTTYFSEIFYFYTLVSVLFIVLGLIVLLCIVCESYYIKVFMAISSILNSLFVLLAITANHHSTFFFWL